MGKVVTEACSNGPHFNIYQDGSCRFNPSGVGATCSGYSDVTPSGDESALQWFVANMGPVSVTIDVGSLFLFYESGGLSPTPTVLLIANLHTGIDSSID